MAEIIYVLCTLTSLACASSLLMRYRSSGHRLLFWSGLCFVGMTLNNLLLVFDKLVFPELDLHSQGKDICRDCECLLCGIACCIHREPLHFHHDGCPACYQREANPTSIPRREP